MRDSQSAFLQTLRIPLKHSKNLFWLVMAYHLLAFMVLIIAELTIITWPFILIVLLSLFYTVYRYQLQLQPMNALEILLNTDDEWFVITQNDIRYPAILLPGSFVHPLLLILSLRCNGKKMFIPLLTDNTHPDVLRRLRVRLRFPHNHQPTPNRL